MQLSVYGSSVRPFVNPFSALGSMVTKTLNAQLVARGQVHGVHGTVCAYLCGRKQVSHCIRPSPARRDARGRRGLDKK